MLVKHVWILPAALTLVAGSAYADINTAHVQMTGRMAPSQQMSTTVVFKLRHQDQLAQFIQNASQPGPQFHKFLTTEQFKQRFGPEPGDVQRVMRFAQAHGLKVKKRYANGMAVKLTASVGQFERAFGVRIANYKQKSTAEARARFHKPMEPMHLPSALSQSGVLTVAGLSNQRKSRPMNTGRKQAHAQLKSIQAPAVDTINPFGELTVNDVVKLYNVNPLYQRGIDGEGVTLGVATYAKFLPSDAQTYWDMIGIDTKPDRIQQIEVGAGGEYSLDAGTGETTLDVEQAGGLAPQADIRVYDAPNTGQGTLDLFNRIVSDNAVDTLSYSYGLAEPYYVPAIAGSGAMANLLAQNQIFMEAAAQGISVFVASGDAGAYDFSTGLFAYPLSSKLVSVDTPSDSPYVTAAGGTTLPFNATFVCFDSDTTIPVRITQKRAWAWDYFGRYAQTCGPLTPAADGDFPIGAGGGVSSVFAIPDYQQGISGINKTPFHQALFDYFPSFLFYGQLPGGFAGRNAPDISMNADPYTGYSVYVTLGGGINTGMGGTSFVAPQLSGLNALFNQDNGGRIGLLNPQLYRLFREQGYGPDSPFNDITHGSNWYWQARPGYDDATGIGIPDAAKLSKALGEPNGG